MEVRLLDRGKGCNLMCHAAFLVVIIILVFEFRRKLPATGGRIYKDMLLSDGYARGNWECLARGLRMCPNVGS